MIFEVFLENEDVVIFRTFSRCRNKLLSKSASLHVQAFSRFLVFGELISKCHLEMKTASFLKYFQHFEVTT